MGRKKQKRKQRKDKGNKKIKKRARKTVGLYGEMLKDIPMDVV